MRRFIQIGIIDKNKMQTNRINFQPIRIVVWNLFNEFSM